MLQQINKYNLGAYHPNNVVIIRNDNKIYNITFETLFKILKLTYHSIINSTGIEEIKLNTKRIEILDGEVFVPLLGISKYHNMHYNFISINTTDGASLVVAENHPIIKNDKDIQLAMDLTIGDNIDTYTTTEFLPMIDKNEKVTKKEKQARDIYHYCQDMSICDKMLFINALNLELESRVAIIAGCIDNYALFHTEYDKNTSKITMTFDNIGIIQQLYNIVKSLGYHEVILSCHDTQNASLTFIVENDYICKYSNTITHIAPLFLEIHTPMIKDIIEIVTFNSLVYDIVTSTGTVYVSGVKAYSRS